MIAATPNGVKLVEVIEVISARGEGTPENPCRTVTQYWSKEGILLAELDPLHPPGSGDR